MEIIIKTISDNHELIFRIIYSYIKDIEDTKEILQDSFADALTHFNPDKHSQFVLPWIIKIAKNNTYTFLKRKRKHEQIDDYIESLPAPTIDQVTLEVYLLSIVSSGFDVPDELLKYLFLSIFNGVPISEISEKTGIPYAKLRYWRDKMLKDLRKRYENEKFF